MFSWSGGRGTAGAAPLPWQALQNMRAVQIEHAVIAGQRRRGAQCGNVERRGDRRRDGIAGRDIAAEQAVTEALVAEQAFDEAAVAEQMAGQRIGSGAAQSGYID